MKNKTFRITYILVALLITISLSSCLLEDNYVDYGDTPVLVQFEKTNNTALFLPTAGDETYNIPIVIIGGKNQPLDKNVDITFATASSSTATEGEEFDFASGNTVTLPAGEMSVELPITVHGGNLDPYDPKTLVLEITSSSLTVSESNTTSILLQQACELNLEGFLGSYTANNARFADPYTVTVEEGPVQNTLLINNLDGEGGTTIIELGTDLLNPTITYRSEEFDAYIYIHSSYGSVWATTISPELSTYNSCDYSMQLEFKRCVSIGCFGGSRKVSLTKQNPT